MRKKYLGYAATFGPAAFAGWLWWFAETDPTEVTVQAILIVATVLTIMTVVYLVAAFLEKSTKPSEAPPATNVEKKFIDARGSSGTRLEGNIFVGDRIHVDARGAINLSEANSVHRESDEATTMQRPMVPISDAIHYMTEESSLGRTDDPYGPQSPVSEVTAAVILRNTAAYGEITIHGRREINKGVPGIGRFSQVWEPIKSEYWRTHEFDLTVVLDDTARWQACETQPENPNDQNTTALPLYAGLRIVDAELRRKWPSASGTATTTKTKRDVWLLDAIYYVANGEWKMPEQMPDVAPAINQLHDALAKVRQAALDGDLPVWAQEQKAGPWVPVPTGYWQVYGFDMLSYLKRKPEKLRTEFKGPGKRTYQPSYQAFMTSRAKVEELWPK